LPQAQPQGNNHKEHNLTGPIIQSQENKVPQNYSLINRSNYNPHSPHSSTKKETALPVHNLKKIAARFGYAIAIHENGLSIAKDGQVQHFSEREWRRCWKTMCAPIYQPV
jgi:hypothetical protein